jgi:hypothetical protein
MLGQSGTSHTQGTLPSAVTTNEAACMDKDASRDPTHVVQGLIPKASPWLWQGQPISEQKKGAGRGNGGLRN